MLSGAGVHKNFGWKPIFKKTESGAAAYNIDISMLDFNTPHRLFFNILSVANNTLSFRFNAAANSMHSSLHRHGRVAGAAHNTLSQGVSHDYMYGLFGHINGRFNLTLEMGGTVLLQQIHGIGYINGNDFSVIEGGGICIDAAPYLTLNLTGNAVNFTYELQIFKSVFTF